ncbi:MAG: UTP--glucose-1-phosphate uridylyltransferase [Desulfobacterales bacterium]|nr:UTP--glucose-1-phosphate uridylyltransferase [Desulfobacterales bacterium]
MTKPEAVGNLPAFVEKMQNEGLQPLVIDTFAYYYNQVLNGETGLVYDRQIQPVALHEIEDFDNLKKYAAAGRHALGHSVRIVLNGGLGTTMGLKGPKSLIEAKNGKTFLEIILKQAENSRVQLVLMNSFKTHDATLSALTKLKPSRTPFHFIQHKFPKIQQQDLSPVSWPENPELEWNPPGHGDVFTALNSSGMLQSLLKSGIQYAFIHNLDNLGARMETSLLGYFAEHQFPFMMEVAEKTPADIKGGHLARQKNGRLVLREAAQCPKDEIAAFQDITRYRFFNTNNIWINLNSLNALFEEDHTLHLPMILNPKKVDPRNENNLPVFQIETAMGAAISLFDGTTAVKVPRSRFFPVKSCNDLLALRSDCYLLGEKEYLRINPNRVTANRPDPIKIKLDPKFYGKIDLLEERFREGLPSLVDCESLSIEGDVYFESHVTIKGIVSIKNSHKTPAVIKKETVIDRDIAF